MDLADPGFPRQQARTRRFTLGRPRSFRVAVDGSRVAFLRSAAGDDKVTGLWVFDVATGEERLVADPRALGPGAAEDLPPAERARRERARESATGIVTYGTDPLLRRAAFGLSGQLFLADLRGGQVVAVPTPGPAVDPWPEPTGHRVAFVCDGALYVGDGWGATHAVAPTSQDGDQPDVSWGLPEFVAAEEMGRLRGYWWSPDGRHLAVTRVDVGPVQKWWITDPSQPSTDPAPIAYPAAGTDNAGVSLHLVATDDAGTSVDVAWDRTAFPYLARVVWAEGSPLTVLVQSRDQRQARVLTVDPATGATETRHRYDDDAWVDIVPGDPSWTTAGGLVTTAHVGDRRAVLVDGQAVTDPAIDVGEVLHAGDDIVFTGSEEATEVHVWRVMPGERAVPITTEPGVHGGAAAADVVVVASATLHGDLGVSVRKGPDILGAIRSLAEPPTLRPRVHLLRAGAREIRTAVLFPQDGDPEAELPVILDPYGGPHHRRVMASGNAFLETQWLANQGFAVVVADGRGTGGRGRGWDRAVQFDLAGPPLEDQVDALHAAAGAHPRLDLSRVGIRGWSFGGYLAALAVLRRPDVFHAAVAGAPVTDWRLYDTHYTERYLGHPDEHPEAYRRSSLLEDASRLERRLLLIHGLSDDNVVVAHTLQLSGALLAAGRPHSVVPLSNVTHMTSQELVAERLLELQVAYFHETLGTP